MVGRKSTNAYILCVEHAYDTDAIDHLGRLHHLRSTVIVIVTIKQTRFHRRHHHRSRFASAFVSVSKSLMCVEARALSDILKTLCLRTLLRYIHCYRLLSLRTN